MRWENEEAPAGVFLGPAEPELSLLDLPAGLRVRSKPVIPTLGPTPDGDGAPVADLLAGVATALARHRAADEAVRFDLTGLSPANLTLLDQILGEGEVGMVLSGPVEVQVQETVLTGVWRLRAADAAGRILGDVLEIATVPTEVVEAASMTRPEVPLPPDSAAEGTMNAFPILAEIRHRAAEYRPGEPNHVISFTLLPVSEGDMALIKATLGLGPVQAVSGGYGTCRVVATGCRHVWSVQYLNARDTVILDTLEIGGVPIAIHAADEDFADSADRLAEILEAYAS
ncbi:MAG: hypothetical protein RLY86_1571 [Pseudomonadota bacterium]|jgi:hydrogenase-1 operon protein HyaF